MYVKVLLSLVFLCQQAWGYELWDSEKAGMEYVYGKEITQKIVENTVPYSNLKDKRIAQYTLRTGHVEYNPDQEAEIHSQMVLAHEGMHWLQDKVLHISSGWGYAMPLSAYTVFLNKLGIKNSIEKEAEIARQLATWYLVSIGKMEYSLYLCKNSDLDLFWAFDSWSNRNVLWTYLETFSGLARPAYWEQGLK